MSHLLLVALAFSPVVPGLQEAEYLELTNTRRSVTNFNIETIRGMAWDAGAQRLYAVNTHGSTLLYFDMTSPLTPPDVNQPADIFQTINNPTALALWEDESEPEPRRFAIVVGGGTHGLVKHDRETGEIVAYLNLPAEPKDIVIDPENDWAWVSCAGAFDQPGMIPQRSGGVVMKVDLDAFAFTGGTPTGSGQHFIDAMRPTFLNFEMGEGEEGNLVFVAPLLSGNRTTFNSAIQDVQVISVDELPDDDLFQIDESGTVSVAANGVGTLITNHARNPVSGKYLLLNVNSLNAAVHKEADHRGGFAENRITSIDLPQSLPHTNFSLDGSGATLSPLGVSGANKPASFPFGLAIHPTGFAALVSSTGDTLRVIDGTNTGGSLSTLRNVGLPEGSIPRGALLGGSRLWVYAWGTNRILEYNAPALLLSTTTSVDPLLFDLGVDPLPQAVKNGRVSFYDADNSLDPDTGVAGKVSCNTCHPAGAMDMLGWDLGDPPVDNKDTMVTQSLLGIEDTFPYHWRGERSLSEFNGAFQFLLGGDQLDADDLADFEAFVFSLQGAANPRQNPSRVVDNSTGRVVHDSSTIPTTTGSAIDGQADFHGKVGTLTLFDQTRCVDCHGGETGSNGQIGVLTVSNMATNATLDVAHLRQLQHKFFQPKYPTSEGLRPRGGFGFSQDGNDGDILDFLTTSVFFVGPTQLKDRVDGASFILQFDEGIAPRAHDGAYLAQDSTTDDLTTASSLISQALDGHCDLVSIGHFLSGGAPSGPLRLWFDADAPTPVFRDSEPGTPGGATFTLTQLETLRLQNGLRTVLLGLPPGNAYRFAVDPDDDGLSFLTESQFAPGALDPWLEDTDGDTFPDGYELMLFGASSPEPLVTTSTSQIQAADTVLPTMGTSPDEQFVTARQSKHFVSFNEPVTYVIQVEHRISSADPFLSVGPPQVRPALRSMDTLIAHHMRPRFEVQGVGGPFVRNDEFRLRVTMTDLAGQTKTEFIPSNSNGFPSDKGVIATPLVPALVFESLDATVTGPVSGAFQVVLDAVVADVWDGIAPTFSLAGSRSIVAQILTETSPNEFKLPIGITVTPTPGTGTGFAPSLTFDSGLTWGNLGDPVEGPLLRSSPTNSSGNATFNFSVTGISTGTRVRINMVGILTRASSPAGTFSFDSIDHWHLPMTATENRFEEFTLP